MSLILRQNNQPNTGPDYIKGSPLTYDQLDGNFAAISASLATVPINPGPGIIINGQSISASVRTVNGIYPVNGNIAISITNVITGPLITRPFSAANATVFVVSQDAVPANNGDAYIYVTATGTWEPIAPLDQVAADARYLKLDASNDPMQATLDMGNYDIINVGTMFGTATTASFITASGVYGPFGGNSIISASIATTASFITGSDLYGPHGANSVTTASYALSASYLINVPNTSRIVSGSTVMQTYSSGVVDVSGSSTSTTKLTVSGSVVVGYNTATGLNAVAFGTASTAAGDYSLVQGKNNIVTVAATNGHAEGESTYVGAQAAHAEGYYTSASQAYAHAEGYNTVAGGQYSHAEGSSTTTQGFFSHAEGVGTAATAQGAHAEGLQTTASGDYSHAEGSGSIALGIGSHAEGLGTIASGSYQLAIGKYNRHNDTTSLFVIGNGSSAGTRSNVVSVTPTSVEITGSLLTTGNVGIGTPTPAYSLDVSQSARIQQNLIFNNGTSNQSYIYFGGSASFGSYIRSNGYNLAFGARQAIRGSAFIQGGTGFTLATIGSFQEIGYPDSSNSVFQVFKGDAVAGTSALYIQSGSGYTGINTTTPTTSLDVNGWINTTSGLAINGSTWSSGVPSGGGRITFTSNQLKYEAGSGAGFAHNVVTNAISRLYVNDNGVGIGTTAPSYSLHIATTTSSGSLNVNNVLYVSESRVGIGTTAGTTHQLVINGLSPTTSNTTGSLKLIYPAASVSFETCLGPIGTALTTNTTFALQSAGSSADHIYIGSSGTQPYNNYNQLVINPGYMTDDYQSTGTVRAAYIKSSGLLTTGSLNLYLIEADPRFNQTSAGPGSVNVKGFYYNPTYIQTPRTASHVAFENTLGDNRFNSTSGTTFVGPVTSTTGGEKLVISGSAKITDVLVLPFQNPLPSSKPTGSVALSGSGGTFEGMYVYNGTTWTKVGP